MYTFLLRKGGKIMNFSRAGIVDEAAVLALHDDDGSALGALAFVVLAAVWLAGGSEIASSRQPVRLTVIQAAGLF